MEGNFLNLSHTFPCNSHDFANFLKGHPPVVGHIEGTRLRGRLLKAIAADAGAWTGLIRATWEALRTRFGSGEGVRDRTLNREEGNGTTFARVIHELEIAVLCEVFLDTLFEVVSDSKVFRCHPYA